MHVGWLKKFSDIRINNKAYHYLLWRHSRVICTNWVKSYTVTDICKTWSFTFFPLCSTCNSASKRCCSYESCVCLVNTGQSTTKIFIAFTVTRLVGQNGLKKAIRFFAEIRDSLNFFLQSICFALAASICCEETEFVCGKNKGWWFVRFGKENIEFYWTSSIYWTSGRMCYVKDHK